MEKHSSSFMFTQSCLIQLFGNILFWIFLFSTPAMTTLKELLCVGQKRRGCAGTTHISLRAEHKWRWFLPRASVLRVEQSSSKQNPQDLSLASHQPEVWERSGLVATQILYYSFQRWHPFLLLTLFWPVQIHGNPNL